MDTFERYFEGQERDERLQLHVPGASKVKIPGRVWSQSLEEVAGA